MNSVHAAELRKLVEAVKAARLKYDEIDNQPDRYMRMLNAMNEGQSAVIDLALYIVEHGVEPLGAEPESRPFAVGDRVIVRAGYTHGMIVARKGKLFDVVLNNDFRDWYSAEELRHAEEQP